MNQDKKGPRVITDAPVINRGLARSFNKNLKRSIDQLEKEASGQLTPEDLAAKAAAQERRDRRAAKRTK